MDDYIGVSVFLGFIIETAILFAIVMPALEWHDRKMNYEFDPDYVVVRRYDAIAMATSLAPAIAMSYTLINIGWLVKVIGGVALGWVLFVELNAFLILSLVDPPFTDLTTWVGATLLLASVGYTLLRLNAYAAIAMLIIGGLIGITAIPHYLDIVLCRRITAWFHDCRDYYCSEFEYRWCRARWEGGHRTPCSCRVTLKCCRYLGTGGGGS